MAQMKGRYFRRDKNLSPSDPYRDAASLGGSAICQRCQAVWRRGKWTIDPAVRKEVLRWAKPRAVVCPACRRAEDRYPGGLVYLEGGYFERHRDQIMKLVHHAEDAARHRNPLERIIAIQDSRPRGILLETTTEKLARRIGRAVNKACGGDLKIQFSHNDKLVRIYWRRDALATA